MPNLFYYVRGALGTNDELLDQHAEAIDRLLDGDYSSLNIEKLSGHDAYTLRLGDAERLLFTTLKLGSHEYLLILDYLPNHEHHKCRFLRSGVLKKYLEKHEAAYMEAVDFQALSPEEAQEKMRRITKTPGQKRVLEYYQNQWIHLNELQQEALSVPLPAVISGVAGSGKSCVALSLLSAYTTQQDKTTPCRLLYLSQSPYLVNNLQNSWNNLPLAVDNPHQVSFLTYEQFLGAQEGVDTTSLVNKDHFINWYNNLLDHNKQIAKAAQKKGQPDLFQALGAERAYQECRIASGYTEAEYFNLGKRQSFVAAQDRAPFYSLYQRYCSEFKDPAFLNISNPAKYDLIIVDEAQDFSHGALQNLRHSAKNDSIVYCMDSHQQLHDSRSVRPFLLQTLERGEAHHIRLNKTYRCPIKIAQVANEVIKAKHQLTGGIADKNEVTHIELAEIGSTPGQVYLIPVKNMAEHSWLKSEKGTDFAVITQEEYKKEAENHFNTKLVFTTDTIKGLEYRKIATYKLYNKELFKEISKILPGKTKQPTHQAKSGEGNETFAPPLNIIYTSYTRAQETLFIIEEHSRENEIFLNKFATYADSDTSSLQDDQKFNTPEEWRTEAIKQLKMDNKNLAKDIFLAKVGDQIAFEALEAGLKKLSIQEAQKAPKQEIPKAPETNVKTQQKPQARAEVAKTSSETTQKVVVPVLPLVPVETRETKAIKALQNEFTLNRLTVTLRLFDIKALLDQQLLHQARYTLFDYIFESPERTALFFQCFANDSDLLKRLPLLTFKEKKHQKTYDVLHILHSHLVQPHFAIEESNPIMVAIFIDRLDLLPLLKELKADPNQPVSMGVTAVYFAAQLNKPQAIKALYNIGANIDQKVAHDMFPAFHAAQNNCIEALEMLQELGANFNQLERHGTHILFMTVQQNHHKALPIIIKAGVDIDRVDHFGRTALGFAAQINAIPSLITLLGLGADKNKVDQLGNTPALTAAANGHVDILKTLKKFDADFNKSNGQGMTPLTYATQTGNLPLVQALHKMGVNCAYTDATQGVAPAACIALTAGHIGLVKYFIEIGVALVSCPTTKQAFRIACSSFDREAQERLEQLLANPTLASTPVFTISALTIAKIMGDERIVTLLQKAQASQTPSPTHAGNSFFPISTRVEQIDENGISLRP